MKEQEKAMLLKQFPRVRSLILSCRLGINSLSVWQACCRLGGTEENPGGQDAGGQRSLGE